MNTNTKFICVTASFAEISTHRVKIEAKMSQKRATILSLGPLLSLFQAKQFFATELFTEKENQLYSSEEH